MHPVFQKKITKYFAVHLTLAYYNFDCCHQNFELHLNVRTYTDVHGLRLPDREPKGIRQVREVALLMA